jgi:predicted XRE-type DNA-binding protein
MAKPFRKLMEQMPAESQERIAKKAAELMAEMPLYELRQARLLSQEQLANLLHIKQPNISKLEKKTDMYISTLRSFINAMGGELEIIAKFPDGEVKITNFQNL